MGIKNYPGKDFTSDPSAKMSLTQSSKLYSSTTFFHQQVRRKGIFHAHITDPDLWPKGSRHSGTLEQAYLTLNQRGISLTQGSKQRV